MGARRLNVGNRRVRAEGRSSASERERAVLLSRIADLELRLQLLEARVRRGASAKADPKAKPEPKGRPRPRCPGCLLELPKGKRKELCVWCGCEMAAVGGAFR